MGKVERRVLTALFAPELSHARRGKGAFKGRRMPESRTPEGEERGGCDAAGILGAGYCSYWETKRAAHASRRRALATSPGRAPPSPGRTASALAVVGRWRPPAT